MSKTIAILSDSTAQTEKQILDAVKLNFRTDDINIFQYSDVITCEQIDAILQNLNGEVLILSMILDKDILRYLTKKATERKSILLVDVLDYPIEATREFFEQNLLLDKKINDTLTKEYFNRMKAIEFAVKYDDCKDKSGILKADIVLIGVSRTSKTPLSLNLAFKNYKVCNIPLMPEFEIPEELFKIDNNKIIGLVIDETSLNDIRKSRMQELGLHIDYSDKSRIENELSYAKKIMDKLNCKVINVTNKTLDETSNEIIAYIRKFN